VAWVSTWSPTGAATRELIQSLMSRMTEFLVDVVKKVMKTPFVEF
jgi:hypothetical protein